MSYFTERELIFEHNSNTEALKNIYNIVIIRFNSKANKKIKLKTRKIVDLILIQPKQLNIVIILFNSNA
jgi:RNase P/RNase MRP subunit p30